ncbi:glycosyltransferase [Vibrio sp. PNB22_3_1]
MLTIGVSTVSNSLVRVLEYIDFNIDKVGENVRFLVCSQRDSLDQTEDLHPRVKLIRTKESGLSRSRNAILRDCSTKWLWVQDDDIELDFEHLERLVEELKSSHGDLCFVKVRSLEKPKEFYKSYDFHKKHTRLNALKISSIEIVVNAEFCRNNQVWFDENLGLGTKLPCGEENKFILELFSCSPCISYLDVSPCFHTTILERRNIDQNSRFRARGYLLSFMPLYFVVPLLIRWTFRLCPQIKWHKKMSLMVAGYFRKGY